MKRRGAAALVLALGLLALVGGGCAGDGKESPIMRLSAEESLAKGKEFLERKKWFLAREHLSHAFEVEPNSAIGREALLLVADAHFLEGGSQNYIKAEAKYRDFQNRFPTSDRAAYVQYQIAASLAKRVRRPDRDQSITRDALEAFNDLVRIFPSSEYVAESQEQVAFLRGRLAQAEYLVGKYNYRRGLFVKCGRVCYRAAVSRLEALLETFPEYTEKDEVYHLLSLAALGAGEREKADRYAALLRSEYPDSKLLEKIDKAYRRQEKEDLKLAASKAGAEAAAEEPAPAGEAADGGDDEADGGDGEGGR